MFVSYKLMVMGFLKPFTMCPTLEEYGIGKGYILLLYIVNGV